MSATKKPTKQKPNIPGYLIVTIWFHDLERPNSKVQFKEYFETTKQRANQDFAAVYPSHRYRVVDTKARENILIHYQC